MLNTWAFNDATAKAWSIAGPGGAALDAVTIGAAVCEVEQCDGTVGYGGSPDSTGETTLDAMVMDGLTRDVGAVGDLRDIKNAIGVARAVMEHTSHTLMAGTAARDFAIMMGFQNASLETPHSTGLYDAWVKASCQPNYFRNVAAQNTSCPPYKPLPPPPPPPGPAPAHGLADAEGAWDEHLRARADSRVNPDIDARGNHDTIGMVVLDAAGNIASGTTTNGANHKVAGRIGDSPIMGAGSYAENGAGAAAATGDGDTMMRFLPTYRAVQNMKAGMDVKAACEEPIREIGRFYPSYQGGLVCLNASGDIAGAGWGWTMTYATASAATAGKVVNVKVPPIGPPSMVAGGEP